MKRAAFLALLLVACGGEVSTPVEFCDYGSNAVPTPEQAAKTCSVGWSWLDTDGAAHSCTEPCAEGAACHMNFGTGPDSWGVCRVAQ